MRCCGKCKNPFTGCGNHACPCHTREGANQDNVVAWNLHAQEPTAQARYWIDQTIDARAKQADAKRRRGGHRG